MMVNSLLQNLGPVMARMAGAVTQFAVLHIIASGLFLDYILLTVPSLQVSHFANVV